MHLRHGVFAEYVKFRFNLGGYTGMMRLPLIYRQLKSPWLNSFLITGYLHSNY